MAGDAERIFLFGAGGHGRSVFEAIAREGRHRVVAVLDDAAVAGQRFRDVEVLGGRELLPRLAADGLRSGFVSIGDNTDREEVVRAVVDAGLGVATVVDPGSHVAASATLGAGTAVMAGAAVGAEAQIADHVILNTLSSVDHDCRVESYAHLSPGVHLSGECAIGSHAHLGIGACVVNGATIGDRARVGAGAAVISDVPAGTLAVGVPARVVEAGV